MISNKYYLIFCKFGGGGTDRNSIQVFRTIYGLADTHSIAWKLTVKKEPETLLYRNQESTATRQKKSQTEPLLK